MDRSLQQKLWKISFVLLVLLIVTIAGLFIWQYVILDNQTMAQQTQEALAQTYFDEDQTVIKGDLSAGDINKLVNGANQLESIKYKPLKKKVAKAAAQYKELVLINHLVKDIPTDIMALEQWVAKPLKPKTNIEQLIQLKKQRVYNQEDAFLAQMNQVWNCYEVRLNRQANIEAQLAQLPTAVTPATIESLSNQLSKLESEIEQFDNMQGRQLWQEQLQKKVRQLAQAVQSLNETDALSKEHCQTLFQSKQMAAQLAGSELDPRLLVALTFDDGPHPEITPQVLDVLKEYNIKGTFFVTGANVERYPELAKRIVDEGHHIGNHSYNHPDLSKLSDAEVLKQLEQTQALIKDATGTTPTMFRMPFGAGGRRVVHLGQSLGLTSIIWNLDTQDWRSHDKDAIFEQAMEYLREKTLMLMHDTHQAAPEALRKIIPALIAKGYEFVDPLTLGYEYHFFD
ncbi:polysaccharide deacetylase family protein [Aerococcaceae bacterium zg-BR22]|uniref:polysaccharide deacetylase family protein n=1 Tax=Aerococcaceae bacterium zg-1292 TaxID=2774330 RepID=UPI0040644D3B|nr:polysaccharide deacetylase family protein [Aerococcaceae bacterium zg-BR22]